MDAGIKVSSCWRFMACPSVIPDVGEDLLAMCQRNVALNSHLTAFGGEAQQVFRLGGRYLCLADWTNRTINLADGVLPASHYIQVNAGSRHSLSFTWLPILDPCPCFISPFQRPSPRPTLALSLLDIAVAHYLVTPALCLTCPSCPPCSIQRDLSR